MLASVVRPNRAMDIREAAAALAYREGWFLIAPFGWAAPFLGAGQT